MTEHETAQAAGAAPRYRYRLSVDMTLAAAQRDYGALVFAGLRRQALMQPLNEPLVAVVAQVGDEVVGLALAELRPGGASAELRSLVVSPAHRRRGVATALVAHVERALQAAGCRAVDWVYRMAWADAPAVERLLAARDWLPPQTRMYHFRTDCEHMLAVPWPPYPPLQPPYAVVAWGDLPDAARREIQTRQAQAPWYPPVLSPFQLEARVEREISVALTHAGTVVGWMMLHRLLPDTLQYTSLFVAAEHQKHAGAIHLVREASLRQLASGVPHGIYQVQADNLLMLRYVEEWLSPYLVARTESRASRKRLTSD